MATLHARNGRVRGPQAVRPPAGPRRFLKPRLERLETRCLPGFLAPLAFDTGVSPTAVAVGDFNGDGIPDLAVADSGVYPTYSGTVSILLGKGDGTFQAAVNYAAGRQPVSVAVGDFNGDGKLDLAVANYGDYFHGSGSGVSVLLGNGNGTFQPAQSFPAGINPTSVAVGDFNGDG